MKMHPTLYRIERAWKLRIFMKIVFWTIILFGFSLGLIWLLSLPVATLILAGVGTMILVFAEVKKIPKKDDIIRLVNSQFKNSEYSTELVFNESAEGITLLQRERVFQALNQEIPTFEFPIDWKTPLWTFFVSILILGIIWQWPEKSSNFAGDRVQKMGLEVLNEPKDTTFINEASVIVSPPSYTRMQRVVSKMDLEILAQSKLRWEIDFEGTPDAVWIKTNQGDSLSFIQSKKNWTASFRPKESGFYSLMYQVQEGVISSPYYQLKLIPDEVPEARISGIPQHQRLDFKKGLEVNFNVSLSDDFGLTDGYIVATITKGAGESVMFREQKIPIPMEVNGKKIITPMTLRPDDFGMEPGNELYFYATAFDNRQPTIQQSRTETFFFILKDTAQVEFSLQGALGVDLMPDFFRSQLQIIIDTEKLLEDKPTLRKKDFNHASNELGFDQKQLRLKYGQFIGEEDESGLEIETEAPEEMGKVDAHGSNVLEEFGHDHDHEHEEGQLMDKGTEPAEEEKNKNPLQEYIHDHGDEETATFHTQTLKSKLKAALTEMWDAELYLRLFQPEKSLPYQYRAQELLKEIKNHARIYVQRIGFDPPPVNEAESRLTGKMKQLNDGAFQEEQEKARVYPSIQKAVAIMDNVLLSKQWNEDEKNMLNDAGNELAGLAIDQPGKYLDALNVLKVLLDIDELQPNDLLALDSLKKVLESAVVKSVPIPAGGQYPMDELNAHYLKKLMNANGSR